jgi:hypothetical protein
MLIEILPKEGLMKILLAVDGSPCSEAAIAEVARRPWPDGSSIKVLTAYELPTPPTPEAWALPVNYFQEMDVALRKQAQNVVNDAIQKLKSRLTKTIALDGALLPGPARNRDSGRSGKLGRRPYSRRIARLPCVGTISFRFCFAGCGFPR